MINPTRRQGAHRSCKSKLHLYTLHRDRSKTTILLSTMPPLRIVLTAFSIVALATSMPLAQISKRSIGGARICTGAEYSGTCWYGVMPVNACIDLNSLFVSLIGSSIPN